LKGLKIRETPGKGDSERLKSYPQQQSCAQTTEKRRKEKEQGGAAKRCPSVQSSPGLRATPEGPTKVKGTEGGEKSNPRHEEMCFKRRAGGRSPFTTAGKPKKVGRKGWKSVGRGVGGAAQRAGEKGVYQ